MHFTSVLQKSCAFEWWY